MYRALVGVALFAACDEGTKTKAKETVDKVDRVIDKSDVGDVDERITRVKAAVAEGREPAEECSWTDRTTETDATKTKLAELRRWCSFDVPIARAQAAVERAEKAKAEQPEAPSHTECQSDDWANMKTKIEAKHASEPRWTDLKARWAKVCPDQK